MALLTCQPCGLHSDKLSISAPALALLSEHGQILQQGDDADDDDHDLDDLANTSLDRQALNQPEHEDDNEEGNQNTDQDGHVTLQTARNAQGGNARVNASLRQDY